MRPTIPALLLLPLAACATVYDLDRRAPDARYVSARALPVVAQCISGQMGRLGQLDIQGDNATRWITLRNQASYPAARVTLRQGTSNTIVSVRQTISYNLAPLVTRCL